MTTTLAEDIQLVRDYIDTNGWHQGDYHAREGNQSCIRGASHRVMKLNPPISGMNIDIRRVGRVRNFLVSVIKEMGLDWEWYRTDGDVVITHNENGFPLYREPVSMYNDDVLKSKEECLEFLDKAMIAAQEHVSST